MNRLSHHRAINSYQSRGILPKSHSSHIVSLYDYPHEVNQNQELADNVFSIIPEKYHPKRFFYEENPQDPRQSSGYQYNPELNDIDTDDVSVYNVNAKDPQFKSHITSLGGHLKMAHMLSQHLSEHPDESLGPYHEGHIEGEFPGVEYKDKLSDFLHFTAPKLMHDFISEYNLPSNINKNRGKIKQDYIKFLEDHVYKNPMVADYIHILGKDE